MKELQDHPLSDMFKEPVDPVRDEAPGYFDIVKIPMDISTVLRKLNENVYNNTQEWKNDVNMITNNAILYNGKKTPVGIVAAEVAKIFRDLSKTICDDPGQIWYNQLIEIKRDIRTHINKRISNIVNENENSSKHPKQDIDTSPEIRRFLVQSMSQEELKVLHQSLQKFETEEQKEKLKKILSNRVESVTNHIDLNLLTPSTLTELKEFVFSCVNEIK